MKKIGLFLLSLLCGAAFAVNQPVVTVSAKQKEVVIRLPANPTTGYQWVLRNYDKKYLTFVKQQYKTKGKLMGSGGETTFYFTCAPKINRPAHTTVKLMYARSWEKGSGEEKNIRVQFLK